MLRKLFVPALFALSFNASAQSAVDAFARGARIGESIRQNWEARKAREAKEAEDRYFATLDARIPDWELINNTTAFVDWLKTRDNETGERWYDLLANAHGKRNANRVIEIFAAYDRARAEVASTADTKPWVQLYRSKHSTTYLDLASQSRDGDIAIFSTRTVFAAPARTFGEPILSSRETWKVDCKARTNRMMATREYTDAAWTNEVTNLTFSGELMVPNDTDGIGPVMNAYCARPAPGGTLMVLECDVNGKAATLNVDTGTSTVNGWPARISELEIQWSTDKSTPFALSRYTGLVQHDGSNIGRCTKAEKALF